MSNHSLKTTHDAFKSLRIKMGRTPSSQDFISFVRRINNRTSVQITKDFLNELQRFKKNGLIKELTDTVKDVKTFLSAFMIIDNKEDIFSDMGGEKEEILFNSAKDMVISFETLCSFIHNNTDNNMNENIHKALDDFNNKYQLYVASFNSWKSGDLNKLLSVFKHSYYELQLTKQVILQKSVDEERELREDEILWREEIDKQCKSIEDKIRKLGGEEAVSELHNPPQNINLDQVVRDVMESEEGKKAMSRDYWKEFGDQIDNGDFSRLYQLLEETTKRLCDIIPNRSDIHTEIKENIDINFIRQKIDNNIFEPSDFKSLVNYIIDKVKQFGPPVEDDNLDKWKTEYFDNISPETTYGNSLPKFFNEVLRRLDQIEETVSAFRNRISTSSS